MQENIVKELLPVSEIDSKKKKLMNFNYSKSRY